MFNSPIKPEDLKGVLFLSGLGPVLFQSTESSMAELLLHFAFISSKESGRFFRNQKNRKTDCIPFKKQWLYQATFRYAQGGILSSVASHI